jgi:hypothetical protein
MSKNDQMVISTSVGTSKQKILTMLNLTGGTYDDNSQT